MLAFLRVLAARMLGFVRPGDADREFADELEAHLDLAVEEKIRQGLDPKEAHRLARIELGGVTQLREAGRDARGLPSLDSFWLDIKLSLRMLRKSWGLTLVGGLAMTLAIGMGVVVFWFLEMSFWPTLPLEDGERVVAIQTWDDKGHRLHPTSLQDVERWRGRLRSVEDFGVFRTVDRNMKLGNGPAEPVSIAEMTASGFQLARVSPRLGRPLVVNDESAGAEPVLVIGHEVWQSRFASDPAILGRTVHLGGVAHSVVGVMPEGFAFPISHQYWTPVRLQGSDPAQALDAEQGTVFARLADGVGLEAAEAEISALGLLPSVATSVPDELELRPRFVPYVMAFDGNVEPGQIPWEVHLILFLIVLLLVPPCANIAILIYARTISRQGELAARFVLGAGRPRIVGQLFIEVLVLAVGAAGLAVVLAAAGGVYLREVVVRQVGADVPFWVDFSLSPRAILFAGCLAVIAAAIAGLVPALKATGRQMQSSFHSLGSRVGLRLGGTWTALVVVQVALCLGALPTAIEMGWGTIRKGVIGPGFAAEQYLTAQLAIDGEQLGMAASNEAAAEGSGLDPFAARFAALQADWARQMEAEAGVLGTTASLAPPGEEPWVDVELQGIEAEDGSTLASHGLVRFNRVDQSFFDVFEIPLLAGRTFEAADFEPAVTPVVVNQTFAKKILGEGNPLGRRVRPTRFVTRDGAESIEDSIWYEIVGVVEDRPANATHGTMYHPAVAGQVHPLSVAVRAGLDPSQLSDRLREITTALDPSLRVEQVFTLDEVYRENEIGNHFGALSLALVTLSVLLLSAAGIYALMSFTVNRRRREIGIRSALGAQPSRVLSGIFGRALGQIGLGVTLGALAAMLLDSYFPIEEAGGWNVPGVIPLASVFMLAVGLFAAAGPARRGLRVEPIEELREG